MKSYISDEEILSDIELSEKTADIRTCTAYAQLAIAKALYNLQKKMVKK